MTSPTHKSPPFLSIEPVVCLPRTTLPIPFPGSSVTEAALALPIECYTRGMVLDCNTIYQVNSFGGGGARIYCSSPFQSPPPPFKRAPMSDACAPPPAGPKRGRGGSVMRVYSRDTQ